MRNAKFARIVFVCGAREHFTRALGRDFRMLLSPPPPEQESEEQVESQVNLTTNLFTSVKGGWEEGRTGANQLSRATFAKTGFFKIF